MGAGSVATTPRVSDIAQTWIPIGVDGGYRVAPSAYVGLSLDWGPLLGNDSGLCSACGLRYDLQTRAELRLDLAPRRTVDPWFGLGAGWEVVHLSLGSTTTSSATYQGPVLADLRFGVAFRGRRIAVGPFLGAALGTFVTRSLDPAPHGESSSVGVALHEWFMLGVRGTYGPG